MIPATHLVNSSTPVSTVSSLGTNNTANTGTAVQSGPYTKAQFQNTMEGSRSVKNIKEIEQLLRDYPAALELYRTGRYKVKLKNEADIERVILVEKRTNKTISNNVTKPNDLQQNKQSILDVSSNVDKTKEGVKKERSSEQTRSRTHSRDHTAPTTSTTDNSALVQATTSSMHVSSHSQPKVDHHRTPSKERDVSVTSQSKQQQQQQLQQQTPRRSHSRDSRSKLSYSKQKGKKMNRDYPKAIVPYVPNANPMGNMWQQSRALQPYYSNPILPHQLPIPNMYMPSPFIPQQNPVYQQPYYYGQPPFPALVYQKPSSYAPSPTIKSTGNITNQTLYSSNDYPSSSKTRFNANYDASLPPTFHTFHPNQQQYPPPLVMHQSQIPYRIPVPWPTVAHRQAGQIVNNNNVHVDSRRGSKNRARSVDTGPRSHPPVHYYNQQQQPQQPQQQQPQQPQQQQPQQPQQQQPQQPQQQQQQSQQPQQQQPQQPQQQQKPQQSQQQQQSQQPQQQQQQKQSQQSQQQQSHQPQQQQSHQPQQQQPQQPQQQPQQQQQQQPQQPQQQQQPQQPQQQQPAPLVTEHHHHHRHHHHRIHPTYVQNTDVGPFAETGRDQNILLKPTTTTANYGTNGEKLTIRQLNEIFLQTDPTGRLSYNSLPNILQRFGISLTENDLISAAQNLGYNTAEPLSARRLVHVLIRLGKIAKSAQQQRSPGSPSVLPEDREVNDIMTQRRVVGAVSTHIHSSSYPNRWY